MTIYGSNVELIPRLPSVVVEQECSDEDDFVLELEMLTYKFQRQTFTPYWKYLQRLGWSYEASHGTYRVDVSCPSPYEGNDEIMSTQPRIRFATAAQVLQFLDYPSLKEVHSNLQSNSINRPVAFGKALEMGALGSITIDKAEQNLARYMRRALLTEMKQSRMEKDDETDVLSLAPKADDDEATTTTPGKKLLRPRRYFKSNTRAKIGSATVSEKGTDMYLHRKSCRKRKSEKKDDAEYSFPTLTPQSMMTLEDIIEFGESLIQQEEEDEINVFSIPEQEIVKEFSEWRFLLSTNHSLLLFGSGSKKSLLTQFAQDELSKEGHVLLINGYEDNVTMDDILGLLVQLFLGNHEPPGELPTVPKEDNEDVALLGQSKFHGNHPLVERATAIGRAIAFIVDKTDREEDGVDRGMDHDEVMKSLLPIFLVIHSLDAPNLANSVVQDALAALLVNSTVSNHVASIRLVASVDQIDAPMHLAGNVTTAANLSWIYKGVHTHRPYTSELRLLSEDEKKRRKTSTVAETMETVQASRVVEVLRGLAPRHTEVVQILAKLQLEERNKSAWVSYQTYFTHCKRACAVTKDTQLRMFLNELNDHGLVASKVQGSSEFVQIPYDDAKLKEILTYNLKA